MVIGLVDGDWIGGCCRMDNTVCTFIVTMQEMHGICLSFDLSAPTFHIQYGNSYHHQ